MANLCIKTPSSASLVLIFQLLVLRPRPTMHLCPMVIKYIDQSSDRDVNGENILAHKKKGVRVPDQQWMKY